jgi:hypothetical protein
MTFQWSSEQAAHAARSIEQLPDAEQIEATVRRLMAAHAGIPSGRGFDTDRRRHKIHAEIDHWLDTWWMYVSVEVDG